MNYARSLKVIAPVCAAFMLTTVSVGSAEANMTRYDAYQRQVDHFDRYSERDEREIRQNFGVESIFDVNTDDKPKLSNTYIENPSRYSNIPSDREFIYDPRWLLNLDRNRTDGRRYPAVGPRYDCGCNTVTTVAKPAVVNPDTPVVDSNVARYNYNNRSRIHANAYNRSNIRFGDNYRFGTTFYSNFQNDLGKTTRW